MIDISDVSWRYSSSISSNRKNLRAIDVYSLLLIHSSCKSSTELMLAAKGT